MIVWFATGNTHKKKELAAILAAEIPPGAALELKIPVEAGIAFDPDETGGTFLDNALIKARSLYFLLKEKGLNGPVIADDSGICVDALGGRPGIYSARYSGPETIITNSWQKETNEGNAVFSEYTQNSVTRTKGSMCLCEMKLKPKLADAERNALLLGELGDNPQRSARFVCAMVLYLAQDNFFAAQETLEGRLVLSTEAARGKGGFGYDPILYIPELGRTVAELSAEEKNLHSHRGKAGRSIARILAG